MINATSTNELQEISRILANNFTPDEYDSSDFEWCALQLVQAGYRKQSEMAKEIFDELLKISTAEGAYDYVSSWEIAELRKKYVKE